MKKPSKKYLKYIAAVLIVSTVLSLCAVAVIKVNDDTFRFNTPTYISLNSKIDGTIKNKDDYEAYIVEVTEPGALSISLDHDNYAETIKDGWRITLYKIGEAQNGEKTYDELVYFNSFWADTTSSWGETGVDAGEYCIMVEPGDYILDVNFTLIVRFSETEKYEREFNDTRETSLEIKESMAFYGSSSQRTEGNDVDYYKLVLKENGYVNVMFTHNDLSLPTVAWIVTLENEEGANIFDFTSKLSEPILSSGNVSLRAGVYYLRVEPQVASGETYSIKFETGEDDNGEFELNDTPETASVLDEEDPITGNLSPKVLGLDKDYYKISLEADGYIDIIFRHIKTDEDKIGWNIRLFKKDGDGYYEIIKKTSAWNDGGVKIEKIGLAAGEYFICIDGDGVKYNSDDYTIIWSFTKQNNFEKEPNNVPRRANEIELSQRYYGKLITKDVDFDNDYYKFTVDKPCNICVELEHEICGDSSVAWTVSVSDEDDDNIISKMSSKDDDRIITGVIELKVPGTYYVHIETGMVESEADYSFIVY